jgi:hypothetical protein
MEAEDMGILAKADRGMGNTPMHLMMLSSDKSLVAPASAINRELVIFPWPLFEEELADGFIEVSASAAFNFENSGLQQSKYRALTTDH